MTKNPMAEAADDSAGAGLRVGLLVSVTADERAFQFVYRGAQTVHDGPFEVQVKPAVPERRGSLAIAIRQASWPRWFLYKQWVLRS